MSRRELLGSLIAGCLAGALSAPAVAQPVKDAAVRVERIEITGSNIKRIEAEGALRQVGHDPRHMDPRGRTFQLGLKCVQLGSIRK